MTTTTFVFARRVLVPVLALALAGHSVGQAGSPKPFAPPQTELVLFRNASVIDGTGAALRTGIDVLIRGERIERIFPDADVDRKLLAEAKIIPLDGKFLIPGLIDAHVHLATPPNRRQAEAILRRDIYGGLRRCEIWPTICAPWVSSPGPVLLAKSRGLTFIMPL